MTKTISLKMLLLPKLFKGGSRDRSGFSFYSNMSPGDSSQPRQSEDFRPPLDEKTFDMPDDSDDKKIE